MFRHSTIRTYTLLVFILFVVISSWETNRFHAAVLEPAIPREAIRLRILANSDAPNDQWIKRKVRDTVVSQMGEWVNEPLSIEQARELVQGKLPELRAAVGNVLDRYDYSYEYTVELGVVPFPAKQYGSQVYPAGDYEAVRIVLGNGSGLNWWCVLFPPLCFVDIAVADEKAEQADKERQAQHVEQSEQKGQVDPINETAQSEIARDNAANNGEPVSEEASEMKYKFFVWELLKKFVAFSRGLFA